MAKAGPMPMSLGSTPTSPAKTATYLEPSGTGKATEARHDGKAKLLGLGTPAPDMTSAHSYDLEGLDSCLQTYGPSLASNTMAAPSVTWLLLPAVVLPPALKASDQILTPVHDT